MHLPFICQIYSVWMEIIFIFSENVETFFRRTDEISNFPRIVFVKSVVHQRRSNVFHIQCFFSIENIDKHKKIVRAEGLGRNKISNCAFFKNRLADRPKIIAVFQ